MSNELRGQLDRVEDSVGKTLASLVDAAEMLALEYTAHGQLSNVTTHRLRGLIDVIDGQGELLARAADLREQAAMLMEAAMHRGPMESDDAVIVRFAATRHTVAGEVETTVAMLAKGGER